MQPGGQRELKNLILRPGGGFCRLLAPKRQDSRNIYAFWLLAENGVPRPACQVDGPTHKGRAENGIGESADGVGEATCFRIHGSILLKTDASKTFLSTLTTCVRGGVWRHHVQTRDTRKA